MIPAHPSRRTGFTLIELLVVISIIAILLALSASATVRVIDVQRGSNTDQTVKILSETLDRHWQWVVNKASRDETTPDQLRSDVLARGGDEKLARVVYVKLRLRQEFPMTFAEAINPGYLPGLESYKKALLNVAPTARTSESSVCLLLALQQARGGITFDADRLGSGAIADSYATGPNASGLKQLVDGWAVPLAFYRWPVENRELNPGGTAGQLGHNDPTDPEGLLASPSVLFDNLSFSRWFQQEPPVAIHRLPTLLLNEPRRAKSFKLIPVVASAGRNGQFGLFRADTTNFSAGNGTMLVENRLGLPLPPEYREWANDNIYSYRLRFGARGD